MNKHDEGYGVCDELGTGDECGGCDAPAESGREDETYRSTTRPIRVRMTDLDTLQRIRENEDETPGEVIHRVLHDGEQTTMKLESVIAKLESVIEKQAEKIKTLRRETGELASTIEVLKASLKDARKSSGTELDHCKEEVKSLNIEIGHLREHIQDITVAHRTDIKERDLMIDRLKEDLLANKGCENDEPNTGKKRGKHVTTVNIIINGCVEELPDSETIVLP